MATFGRLHVTLKIAVLQQLVNVFLWVKKSHATIARILHLTTLYLIGRSLSHSEYANAAILQ